MRKLYIVPLVAGIWLILGPFILNFGPLVDMPGPAVSETLVLGILVVGLAAVALMGGILPRAVNWFLLLFGIWVICNPVLYGSWPFDGAEMANTALAGAVIILIALLELVGTRGHATA